MTLEERAERVAAPWGYGGLKTDILAALREAVAERDREWQSSIGISVFSGPTDVRPAFEEAKRLWVAEERKALLDIVTDCRPPVEQAGIKDPFERGWLNCRAQMRAALNAREKA